MCNSNHTRIMVLTYCVKEGQNSFGKFCTYKSRFHDFFFFWGGGHIVITKSDMDEW